MQEAGSDSINNSQLFSLFGTTSYTPDKQVENFCDKIDENSDHGLTGQQWIDQQQDALVNNLMCSESCPCPPEAEEFWPGRVYSETDNVKNWRECLDK